MGMDGGGKRTYADHTQLRPSPFAVGEQPPPLLYNPLANKYSENHTHSQVVFGDANSVNEAQIYAEQQVGRAPRRAEARATRPPRHELTCPTPHLTLARRRRRIGGRTQPALT